MVGQIYLDHAGSTLHADSQVRKAFEDISQNIYGNPHSANSLGNRTSHTINKIRDSILHFFNTTSKDYSVIFTSGKTTLPSILTQVRLYCLFKTYWRNVSLVFIEQIPIFTRESQLSPRHSRIRSIKRRFLQSAVYGRTNDVRQH